MKKILNRKTLGVAASFVTGYYIGRNWNFSIQFSVNKNV